MGKIAYVGEERLGLFLRNFDIDIFPINTGEEAFKTLEGLIKEKKFQLILVSEDYSDFLQGFYEKRHEVLPVIFMLPSPKTSGISIKLISKMVEKAVGIDILSKSKDSYRGELWKKE
ncbi:MAG: V-type ATP synthase subunit F [Fervidobacterium sp.]